MKAFEKKIFDSERALYGETEIELTECRFEGELDGESALKECRDVTARGCFFALRYPLWHDERVRLYDCEMSESCRAALWYTDEIEIDGCRMNGTKALRECRNVAVTDSEIVSSELCWMCDGVEISDSSISGEYFMLHSTAVSLYNVTLKGKYSFQYLEDAVIEGCVLDTKDALWHAKRVTVRDSVVKGEYLGWYCEDVTFERCKIIGTQPLCYCKRLRLIDCECIECDLAFEKSEVEATLECAIESIKNPKSGNIYAPGVGELIFDDEDAKGAVHIGIEQ